MDKILLFGLFWVYFLFIRFMGHPHDIIYSRAYHLIKLNHKKKKRHETCFRYNEIPTKGSVICFR